MPSSRMSSMSTSVNRLSEMAYAIAYQEILRRIQNGQFHPKDQADFNREYENIYEREYYRLHAQLMAQERGPRIVYAEDPSRNEKKRYFKRHTVARFCRGNRFIQAYCGSVTVSRIIYPLDKEVSLETKEAFLTKWPGPLNCIGEHMKQRVADYINVLLRHDSQRHPKYSSTCDPQRKTILRILIKLLNSNGFISAPGISELLLDQDQTQIRNDDKPIETLKKHLLLGERRDAIDFAQSKKMWDYALALDNLDKYQPIDQPPGSIPSKEYPTMKLLDEYISNIEDEILNLVYRSLLNRIISNDPQSVRTIKPNVGNNSYDFAILTANDVIPEFDDTNEIFKLIIAVKQNTPNRDHLISLGYLNVDTTAEQSGDLNSNQSHVSFKKSDTYASKTLTISNTDLLILNEVWEYCINLAKGTCNPSQYEYLVDLIPYKLVFASRLLDFGMYNMFPSYLDSIKCALEQSRNVPIKDPFYDWDTIEECVNHLDEIWKCCYPESKHLSSHPPPLPADNHKIFRIDPTPLSQSPLLLSQPISYPSEDIYNQPSSFTAPLSNYNSLPPPVMNSAIDNLKHHDFLESAPIDEPRQQQLQQQPLPPPEPAPPQQQQQQQLQPQLQPQQHQLPPPQFSHPSRVAPPMFNQQAIQEEEDVPEPENDVSPSSPPFKCSLSPISATPAENNQQKPTKDETSGFLANLGNKVKGFMPKSNSKEMNLGSDLDPNYKFQSESADYDLHEAPPVFDVPKATNYSFGNRKTTARYPRAGP